jgi:hypothetical protein
MVVSLGAALGAISAVSSLLELASSAVQAANNGQTPAANQAFKVGEHAIVQPNPPAGSKEASQPAGPFDHQTLAALLGLQEQQDAG